MRRNPSLRVQGTPTVIRHRAATLVAIRSEGGTPLPSTHPSLARRMGTLRGHVGLRRLGHPSESSNSLQRGQFDAKANR